MTTKTSFTSEETRNITDLAGIGPLHPTEFLLLKNGSANLHPNDIILRPTVDPVSSAVPKPITTVVSPSISPNSAADRLKEIEDLNDRKLMTDAEYQDKRAKIIAEL